MKPTMKGSGFNMPMFKPIRASPLFHLSRHGIKAKTQASKHQTLNIKQQTSKQENNQSSTSQRQP